MRAFIIATAFLAVAFAALGCSSDDEGVADVPSEDGIGDGEVTPGALEVQVAGYSLDDASTCTQGPCVSLGTIARQAGAVDVPLVVLNARSIERFTFDWTYDHSILLVDDVQPGDVEGSPFSQFRCVEPGLEPGKVTMECSMSGSCQVGGTGILATLHIVPRKEGGALLLDEEANTKIRLWGCDGQGNVVEYSVGPAIRNAEISIYASQ